MRSLYEINKTYIEALDNAFTIDEETGEVIFDQALLDEINGEFNEKVDNIACLIKDLENLSEGIKNEKKALDDRMKANDKKVESLKKYITVSLEMRDMDKLETARNKISFRNSKSVEVIDENKISDIYWKEEIVKKLDKKTILAELKNGAEIEGCKLLENRNIQIK